VTQGYIRQMKNKSDFSLYSAGYVDGYQGNQPAFSDEWYMTGYREGKEDDAQGMPCRYTPSLAVMDSDSRVVTPIKPSQVKV
jgi:hypothetical protein